MMGNRDNAFVVLGWMGFIVLGVLSLIGVAVVDHARPRCPIVAGTAAAGDTLVLRPGRGVAERSDTVRVQAGDRVRVEVCR